MCEKNEKQKAEFYGVKANNIYTVKKIQIILPDCC